MKFSPAYHKLLARIHRRYSTLLDPVELCGRKVPFRRIADPDVVLNELAAEEDRAEKVRGERTKEDSLHLPYWAELWDSAIGLSQRLIGQFGSDPVASKVRLLDLGCGMGLTGTVAASLGLRVTFADLENPALLFAKLNSLAFTPTARARQLNWQTARLRESFDVIIGADILYERKQWDHLEPFWRHHLAPGSSVWLGEPGRPTGTDFPAWVTERGWRVAYHFEPVKTRAKPIRLFEVRLA